MSQELQNEEENKGQGIQIFGGKCLSQFRARKIVFLVEPCDPYYQGASGVFTLVSWKLK